MTLLYEYSFVSMILYNEFYGLHYLMNLFNFCLNLLSCLAYFHKTYCAHSHPSGFARNAYGLNFFYRDAAKSLARPGRKQATATEDFDVHISYLLS